MEISDTLNFVSTLIAAMSICLVVLQLRNDTAQRRIESFIQILSINRELMTLGFSNPDLFNVLLDGNNADAQSSRRFIQLWLNQFSLIHAIQRKGFFEHELRESLERDMREFMTKPHVQSHWRAHRVYYPASFQMFVEKLVTAASAEQALPPPMEETKPWLKALAAKFACRGQK